jgi:hypothetical protein
MTTTMEKIALDQARRAGVAQMAATLQSLLGQKVTAAIVGVDDPTNVGGWARGEPLVETDVERRLRNTFRIAALLMQADTPDTVRAWFLGMNPLLEDRAPAELIADDPLRVLQAARAFMVTG